MGKLSTGLKSLWSLFLQDLINIFHVFDQYPAKDKKIKAYAKELRKTGIIILPDFISPECCDKLYTLSREFLSLHPETVMLENGTYVDYRGRNNGPDKGMVDVSWIDRSISEIDNVDISLADEIMKNVSGMSLYLSQINLYYNREIKGTRIDHVDNCQPVITKVFSTSLMLKTILSDLIHSSMARSAFLSWYTLIYLRTSSKRNTGSPICLLLLGAGKRWPPERKEHWFYLIRTGFTEDCHKVITRKGWRLFLITCCFRK